MLHHTLSFNKPFDRVTLPAAVECKLNLVLGMVMHTFYILYLIYLFIYSFIHLFISYFYHAMG